MALSGVQHWWLLEGYLGVAWSSHFKQNMTRVLNNSWALKLIFFWLFWSSIALSSSIHRHICKGCPLPWPWQPGQPVASQECACKFLLLVWLLQSCAGCAGPGSGGKDARSADEGHMCPVPRPVHPCQQQAQGKANGTQLVAAVTTSLLFILGIQQHPAAAWTTSQQHDTGAQGRRE